MVTDDREFQKRKDELEERVARLETERITLISEVESLREKRTLLDLEKKAHGLQDTVDMLKKEKEDLEGQISSLETTP
jgi:uncharacterized coiled-coil DUF342 family protein